jgi:hypothetical protein
MAILYTAEQRAQIRAAKQIEKRARKEAQKDRPKSEKGPTRDREYQSWLHEGLPCIACLRWGSPKHPTLRNVIEAAHIWIVEGAMKGVRNSDWTCIPLCTWHHQVAPDACDKAQRKFFDRLAVDPIALCQALYGAFLAGRDGFWIIHGFAGRAPAEPPSVALSSHAATTPDAGPGMKS